jgi:antitoxin CptB
MTDAAPAGRHALAQVPGELRWRCRRGMKELDIVLLRYLDIGWLQAAPGERLAFERLLQLPDPVLAAALLRGDTAGDAEVDRLLARMRDPV